MGKSSLMAERQLGRESNVVRPSYGGWGRVKRAVVNLAPEKFRLILKRYVLAHQRHCSESVDALMHQPLGNLLIVLILGITLSLPAGTYLVFSQAFQLGRLIEPAPKMTVFFKTNVSRVQAQALTHDWVSSFDRIESVEFIDNGQGLKDFTEAVNLDPELLEHLQINPLPHKAVIRLVNWSSEQAKDIQEHLYQQYDSVDWIQLDLVWMQRFQALLELFSKFFWVLTWALGMVVILTVSNTIRLAIEDRRQEIVVSKLVGATNAFVRRPFLYHGCFLGLFGGIFTLLLLKLAELYIAKPFAFLLEAYAFDVSTDQWRWALSLTVLVGASFLGLVGAWLAARRHLVDIEP